jgi:hypothetical protein
VRSVPFAALERAETLQDGASALHAGYWLLLVAAKHNLWSVWFPFNATAETLQDGASALLELAKKVNATSPVEAQPQQPQKSVYLVSGGCSSAAFVTVPCRLLVREGTAGQRTLHRAYFTTGEHQLCIAGGVVDVSAAEHCMLRNGGGCELLLSRRRACTG